MTAADEVLARVSAADVDLTRIVFVNNSGVPRGRVVDADGLEGALADGVNVTQAMQSFNALDGDETLRAAMGDTLVDAYVQVKRSEWEQSTDEDGEWDSEYLGGGF